MMPEKQIEELVMHEFEELRPQPKSELNDLKVPQCFLGSSANFASNSWKSETLMSFIPMAAGKACVAVVAGRATIRILYEKYLKYSPISVLDAHHNSHHPPPAHQSANNLRHRTITKMHHYSWFMIFSTKVGRLAVIAQQNQGYAENHIQVLGGQFLEYSASAPSPSQDHLLWSSSMVCVSCQ